MTSLLELADDQVPVTWHAGLVPVGDGVTGLAAVVLRVELAAQRVAAGAPLEPLGGAVEGDEAGLLVADPAPGVDSLVRAVTRDVPGLAAFAAFRCQG